MSFQTQYHIAEEEKEYTPAAYNTEMSRLYGQLNEAWDATIVDIFTGTGTSRIMYYADANLELQVLGRDKADANDFFVGLGNGQAGELLTRGLVGGFSSLINGKIYCLGLAGQIVIDAPAYGAGQWYLPIGKAIGSTHMFIDIDQNGWQRR